jgi:DNA-binding transcriptional ArsR family regulator
VLSGFYEWLSRSGDTGRADRKPSDENASHTHHRHTNPGRLHMTIAMETTKGFNARMTEGSKPQWNFLTNHFHVLVCLSRDPTSRIRDLADEVGITQRAVQRILAELVEDKALKIRKDGRRNTYTINPRKRLHHPLESKHSIGELLEILS